MAAMKQAITGVTSGSRSAEFWRQLMKKWKASGESQRAIAEAAGVSVHTFQYWRAKLQAADAARPRSPSAFVEVTANTPERSEVMPCRVRVGDGVLIELPTLPPPEWVRALGGR